MKIAIQVYQEGRQWAECLPTLHEVEDTNEAETIAFAISKQFGRVTVRLTYLFTDKYEGSLRDYISRLNGNYLQAR